MIEKKALNEGIPNFNETRNLLLKLATKRCDQLVKIVNKAGYTASLRLSYVLQIGSNRENVVQTVGVKRAINCLNFTF